MPREEKISVSIVKSPAYSATVAELKKDAASLQSAFGSIKVGDSTKALKDQASASKEVSRAAIENAKAQKEAANAERARYQAVKELENATKAHIQAEKEAQNVATAQAKTQKEAYNAIKAKEQAEKAAIQTQKAQLSLVKQQTQGNHSLVDSLKSMALQYLSLQKVMQSFRYAFSEMKSMSDEMVIYRKVTNATAQEMEQIRSAAYSTAKKYGQSPSDFLASASNMARAGYGANSVAMAELATKTQLVGDMTSEAASKFLLAVDAGYKYQGNIESLTAVLDAANEVDNNFATSIEKISEGMTLVASLAGSVHVPVEQLIAALGTMTAATQRSGGEMARGLRSIMLNVLGDTTTEIEEGVTVTEENIKSLTDALNKYGDSSIAAARNAGKLINPMQAISSLAKAWKAGKLDESTLFGISKDIAGQRYYNAFSSLIQNYDMYESMLEKIAESAGSAENEVAAMMDSWSVKTQQLKDTGVEMVSNSINEGFIKNLIDAATAGLEYAGSLENVAVMALGAYEAIKSFSAGLNNIHVGKSFGGFNLGTTLLGIGIAGIGAWKAAYEKNIREMQEAATKAVSEAVEKTSNVKSLESIVQRYSEIASDGIQAEKGELEELNTLQSSLNGLLGDQATAIDIVNGKYDDTITNLKKITEEQKESAKITARNALSKAIAGFNTSDFNGTFRFGNDTGIKLPSGTAWYDILSQYQYLFASVNMERGSMGLGINKPKKEEEILAFLDELKNFYRFAMNIPDISETNASFVTKLTTFYETVFEQGNKIKTARDTLNELVNGYKELGEEGASAAGSATDGMSTLTESVYSLTKSIESATAAKEKFDDAMKTTKADAFNDYNEAFKTLKDEIDAGRVNSTAFYASARMILGEAAYEKTGGTSKGVMEALNNRGISGSVKEAWDILSAEYQDEAGKIFSGGGIVELLSRTKGYEDVYDANGKIHIPELTTYDLEVISKRWGGISKDYIMAVLDAFDQHDIEGATTDADLKIKERTAEETKAIDAPAVKQTAHEMVDLMEGASGAAESSKEAAEAAKGAAEATAEASENYKEAAESVSKEDPMDKAVESAEAAASKWEEISKGFDLNIVESIEDAMTAVDNLVESIKTNGNLEINIDSSESTKRTQAFIEAIQHSIDEIDRAVANGYMDVEVAAELKGNLLDALQNAQEKIHEIESNDVTTDFKANTSQADSNVSNYQKTLDKIPTKITTVLETINTGNGSNGNASGGNSAPGITPVDLGKNGYTGGYTGDRYGGLSFGLGIGIEKKTLGWATGTRNHPGGLSLVNDGAGPELIVQGGRAFIAGNGGPSLINLEKGAKVFTASETKNILNGGSVPAYSAGTGIQRSLARAALSEPGSITASNSGRLTVKTAEASTSEKETASKSSSSSSSSSSGSSKEKEANDSFARLKELIDYILDRIGIALSDQMDIIDEQIDALKAARDASEQQNELEERQKAVAEAQKDLQDALNERTVRYLGEDGKWHWMADARNVKSAQESLQKAQESLRDYEDEMAFNAQIEALENQKKALQDEYNGITKAWSEIQSAVNTPTGDLTSVLAEVLSGGTPQEQKGASTVQNLLINSLLKGGSYSGNYSEALGAIAKATAGSPIMPGEESATLASLIAKTGGGVLGASITDALRTGASPVVLGSSGNVNSPYGGGQINYNYFVDGIKLGADQANQPLSSIMRNLSVYTNTNVG